MAKGKKTGGRLPDSLNKATVEAREACAALVDDPEYRRRWVNGSVAVSCHRGRVHDLVLREGPAQSESAQKVVFTWERPD